ncbi:GNAT family N-acetyltransferase [Halosolutus amylolyticus]|uniref:GNAT family N-acetyltransferase n=1 Tax=Halosolutus amylolyticus TaxID=2932267 RepID=A0ABD5PTY9_9EURY|nr:GNAT family N-acetyltransferase [Halosolutus amylolyticus]
MSVHSTLSFDDPVQRTIYEYVERHGAVTPDELARSIRVETGRCHSKPARSATYTEEKPLSPDELRSCIEELKERGDLVETNGKLRIAVAGSPTELELDEGTVTVRPAREEDRPGVVETMRTVATDGTYIVAENVAAQLERESALIRANDERSRMFFVAAFEPDEEGEEKGDADSETGADATDAADIVGWLHVNAPELPSLRHTAEVTVGVRPDVRRNEIGSTLLEDGLEWADDAGYRKIYQNIPATNEEAIAFLEANGWDREGRREEQYLIDEEFVDEVLLATWP